MRNIGSENAWPAHWKKFNESVPYLESFLLNIPQTVAYYKILSSPLRTKWRRNVTIKFSRLPSRFIQSLQHFPTNFLANSFKFPNLFTWNKTSTRGNKPASPPRINVKASLSNLSYIFFFFQSYDVAIIDKMR